MLTPRPDRFTYPLHTDTAGNAQQAVLKKRWLGAVFAGGLIVAFAFGLLFTLGS
jgi:hypothetical protein